MDSTENQMDKMLEELKSRNKAKVILETGILVILQLFLLVGNSITLSIMVLNRRMRTVPNLLVASLAISDLGLGVLTSYPLALPTLASSQWRFSDVTCQYQGYICITLIVASTQTLALMAVNRYFRIVQPAKYRRHFTKKKTSIMIFASWIYAVCNPLPYLLSGHKMVFHPSKFFCYLQIDTGAFTAYLATINLGIPACIILYCYLSIYKTVRSHKSNSQLAVSAANTVNVEEINVARTLFVIVVFFTLCWAPILIIDLVDTIRGSWIFPREVYVAYSFLATISSAFNPVIYGVMNKNFRNEYLKILCCIYCRPKATVEPSIIFVP